jgi:hypothetical protein
MAYLEREIYFKLSDAIRAGSMIKMNFTENFFYIDVFSYSDKIIDIITIINEIIHSNGENITNVKEAIDELYTKANSNSDVNKKYDLIWENKNIHAGFEPTTISIDLSNYTSVIVMGKYHMSDIYDNNISFKKIDVGSSGVLTINYSQGDSTTRNVIVKNNEIEFKEGHMWNNDVSASSAIPMYIVGIK